MASGDNRGLQGIGAILGSSSSDESQRPIRRALSADMSSRKWLGQNGFGFGFSASLKKTASSQQLINPISSSSSLSDQDQPTQLDVWNSIQSDKMNEAKKLTGSSSDTTWSSILSQKSEPLPAPYVHPLAKRSRSLSQKSLEICTESLGSETGSDGFSSYSPSETSDAEREEEEPEQEQEQEVVHDHHIGDACRSCFSKKSKSKSSSSPPHPPPCNLRSFPPPLPSLSRPGIQMRPRRMDGRLVLEAVSVPAPAQNFHAQRQNGRLKLTFINPPSRNAERNKKDFQERNAERKNVEVSKQEEEERMLELKKGTQEESNPIVQTGVMDSKLYSVLNMKKLTSLPNRNPISKLKQKLQIEEEEDQEDEEEEEHHHKKPLPISLVPRLLSTSATKTSFINTYDYCWRPNYKQATIAVGAINNHPVLIHHHHQEPSFAFSTKSYSKRCLVPKNLNPISLEHHHHQKHQKNQQFVLLSAGDYYMDSLTLKGCKEPRKSLLIREPCCIATS